ncbi:phage antirepressor KilAC domain-containing protein [uncultured Dialister sp.]|jgi:anti-repressor protein|uniref:phage antirepressor KilAC domain-containing protein n=1 Tax=uncultured Dialister sp. TaxID=278064 RepID=UPI0020677F47|nr:phage antirepressor KilAC domain-containing protein [uncultured Dialister sp.]DAV49527.1 MAG TPA: repressor domain protein [Caudoviricetes sp.]
MNEITIFHSREFGDMRTLLKNGEPWFVGKDVAEILGYKDTVNALKAHVDVEDKTGWRITTPSRGKQTVTAINESGLYSLILSSKLPGAKRFKHWVTSEVLPAIRKTGGYIPVNPGMSDMEVLARAVLISKKTIDVLKEENRKLETANEAMKPKALFADAYAATKDGILVGAMAKMLRQNGIEIGQNRLFRILRERGYLMKGGEDKNMPTQRSMESGWFRIKARTITTPDGSNRSTRTVLVTGKGQQYFVNLFLKEEPGLW